MAIYRYSDGSWRNINGVFAYAGGAWRPIRHVYDGQRHDPVWSHRRGPTIVDYGAASGQPGTMKETRLTLNNSLIPAQGQPSFRPVISARLEPAAGRQVAGWHINRVTHDGQSQQVATGGTTFQPGNVDVSFTENFNQDFKPDSHGWRYVLTATDNLGGFSTATCTIRVVTAPTLTAFAATPPANVQAPGVDRQCSFLTWTGTDGDPAATWTLSQSGRTIAALPSSHHLSAAQGRATGNHRTRVCVNTGGGGSTTLTLTATGEGGTASRQVAINWS